jgi:hypothetical protein
MNLLNIMTLFPNKASCKARRKKYIGSQCGYRKHYWKKGKEYCDCKCFGYRQRLKSDIAVHHDNQLSFYDWFVAIHLPTLTKKNFSANELHRRLSHITCNLAWVVLYKLHQVKGICDIEMFVIKDLKTVTSTSYMNVKNIVREHCLKVISENKVSKILLWRHMTISNTMRILLDIFHNIKPEYLQNYLNKICHKFNRRYFGEQRLTGLCQLL